MPRLYWGGMAIDARDGIGDSASPNTATRIAQGFEGQRIDLVGIIPVKFAGYNGGFVRGSYIHDWRTELNKVAENTGVQSHLDRVAALGWLLTTQATLTAVDHSGFRAANKRVHAAMYNNRFVATLGTQLFLDTSTSDPALTVPSVADGLTDIQTSLAVGQIASTRVLMAAGSTNDDIQYTTDPTAGTVSWTKAVTLTDTPYINWIQYFPELGSGVWIVCGRPSTALGAGLYFFKKDDTLPATLSPVVLKDTATQINTSNTVLNTGAVSPASAASINFLGGSQITTSDTWVNPTNALASDNARATSTYSSGTSRLLATAAYGLAVPANSEIVGVVGEIEKSEALAADNVFDDAVLLTAGFDARVDANVVGGNVTAVGLNKASATEWPVTASEAYTTYGGAADLWGAALTPAIVNSSGFGLAVRTSSAAGAVASVDHMRMTVYYRSKGTMPVPGLGGYSCGALPSNPNVIFAVEPVSDDLTGITVRRVLKKYSFSWDSEGQRPLVDVTFPATGLSYVEDIIPYTGGVLAIGDTSSGVGKQVKHVSSDGEVRNYNFPGFHGSEAVGIVNGFDLGNSALMDVADEDGGNAQWWLFNDGKYHGSYPQQSSANAISSIPIGWAERTLHTSQNRIYRFFPVSTTNLAATRAFVPRNIFDDPMVTNLSEPKVTTAYIRSPKFEIGPTEGEQSILLIRHLGDQISTTASTYGTALYEYEVATDSVAIDTTFAATPPVSTGALDAPFEEYKVPSSGVAARIVMAKMTLTNAGSSSIKTPNGVPWYTEFKSKQPLRSLWTVPIDAQATAASYISWTNFVRLLKAKSAESPTQKLMLDSADGVPAELVGWDGQFEVPALGQPVIVVKGKEPVLRFQEMRGKSTA